MTGSPTGRLWDGSALLRKVDITLLKLIERVYALFLRAANSVQSPFLLAIRLYWGWQFLESGIEHLRNMSDFVTFMSSHGVPAPWFNAHFVAALEAGGGILLILGLGSRLIAIPLAINMLVAFITTERDNLSAIFSDHAEDFYKALPFTFLFVSLIILIFGPGWFSLDTIIKAFLARRQKAAAPPAP
jgi:putative oxidoreductase